MSAVAPRQERYFNPRSHEGSDELGLLIAQVAGIFQSSLPRGERPTPKPATTAGSDFNPRSHEGSDAWCTYRSICLAISILAPTRGATAWCSCLCTSLKFQSSLPRGERLSQIDRNLSIFSDFNPRSHEGSDPPRKSL